MSENPVQIGVGQQVNNDLKCPASPPPEVEWTIPEIPEDYYKDYKIPKDQIEEIEADRTKALNNANEKYIEDKNQAEEIYQTASAEFSSAEKKQINDKKLIDEKIKNKKIEIRQNYRKELRGYLPKNCGVAVGKEPDIEDDTRVPRDKFAISVGNSKKALAEEEVEYLKKLKIINDLKSDADHKWKKAKETYDASICSANAALEQANIIAEITFRTKVSEQLSMVRNQ